MKVLMLATSASPEGVLHAGQVYDLPRKRADALLKNGPHGLPYARRADGGEPVSLIAKAKDAVDE